MSGSAEANNLVLFEKMAKKMIEGDFEHFREATSLLTTWLSKRQAYYPGALLQIIRLLFIAQHRVRDEVKFDHGLVLLFRAQRYSDNPFAAAYIKLVSATIPFQDAFLVETEKGLKEGYQHLLTSISAALPQHEVLLNPQRSPTPQPINSTHSATNLIEPLTPPSEVAIPLAQVVPVIGPDPVLYPESCTPNERAELEGSTSAAETRNPAPTSPKPIESSKGSPAPESKEITISIFPTPAEQHISDPTEPHPSPASAIIQPIEITASDSNTLDFDLPAKIDEMDLLRTKANTTPRGQQLSDNLVQHQGILPNPPSSNPEHNISLTEPAGVSKPKEATDVTVDDVSGTLSLEQSPPLEYEETDQMELDPLEVQRMMDALVQDLSCSMDLTAADMEFYNDIHEAKDEAQSHGESSAMEVEASESAKPVVPPNLTSEQVVKEDEVQPLPEPTQKGISHASRAMGIIARQQGLNGPYRIFIDFDITSAQFELIQKWSKRLGSLAELESSVCVTLGCYLLADLKEQFDTGGLSSFEQQISCTPSKWPQRRGSLSLKVISADSKEENLPLSPPFQVTPNNLLDVSGLLAEGRNKLQLHQTTDLQQFLFVLHAHHPNRQQLSQVQAYMDKTKEWQKFLEDFAAPLAYDSLKSLLSSGA